MVSFILKMFPNAAHNNLVRMSTTRALLSQATCKNGTRDLRQPHAALEQRFETPDEIDERFREHGSEMFWFH
jgi:hypothetical protein